MGRLTNIKPRLATLAPRIQEPTRQQRERQRDTVRAEDQPWRAWYWSPRWRGTAKNGYTDGLRFSILARDGFTCRMCHRLDANTSNLVVDHREPHKGDEAKFWDEGNLQTLCKPCHDGEKQSMERQGKQAAYRPKWLRPSLIPLTIVCGPPASGKSTYVRQHAGKSDIIIDLDVIASSLSGEPLHNWNRDRWIHPALFKRNDMLGDLSRPGRHSAAWFIVSEAKAFNRQWWHDTLKPQAIVVLETPEAQCIANAMKDDDLSQKLTADGIVRWWFEYEPRQGDTVIRPDNATK